MDMYELCGLTEEEAKEEEKIIKAYVNGRTISDANDRVMDMFESGEQDMKRSVYRLYTYGVITGLCIREQEMLEKFDNMIQTIKQR